MNPQKEIRILIKIKIKIKVYYIVWCIYVSIKLTDCIVLYIKGKTDVVYIIYVICSQNNFDQVLL